MDRLIDALINNFGPVLDQIWNSLIFWRSITLIIILIALGVWKVRDSIWHVLGRSEQTEHDKRVFTRSDELLTETHLYELIGQLRSDHSFFRESVRPLSRFIDYYSQVSNHYLNPQLETKMQVLVENIDTLDDFVARNFWYYPKHQERENPLHCMHPELNMDREGTGEPWQDERYQQYAEQLKRFTSEVMNAYRDYRGAVKKILYM